MKQTELKHNKVLKYQVKSICNLFSSKLLPAWSKCCGLVQCGLVHVYQTPSLKTRSPLFWNTFHINNYIITETQNCQSAFLSRNKPKFELVRLLAAVHDSTRFHENCLKIFHVILLIDKRTKT